MRTTSFFGVVNKERLEDALNALVSGNTNELSAVELLNKDGEIVASAGPPIEMPAHNEFDGAVFLEPARTRSSRIRLIWEQTSPNW